MLPTHADPAAVVTEEGRDVLLIHLWGVVDAHEADPKEVERRARGAVERARRDADAELLSLALRALAWVHRVRRQPVEARGLLDDAVMTARRHGLREVEGAVLMSRAYLRQEIGDLAGARRDLDRAVAELDAAQVAPERLPAVGRARLARAVLDHNAGRLADAEQGYLLVLDVPQLPVGIRVVASNNLAMVLAERAAHARALRVAEAAVVAAEGAGPAMLAPALQTRGWINVRAGRLAAGLRDFERASAVYSAAGIPLGEYYTEYADAMADLRLLPEAAAAAGRAEDEFERAGLTMLALEAGLRRARVLLLSGDVEAAARAAAELRETAQRQRRARWRDRAALVALEAGYLRGEPPGEHLSSARRVAGRLERADDVLTAVEAHVLSGRLAERAGDRRGAVRSYDRAERLAVDGPVLVRVKGKVAGARAAMLRGDARAAVQSCDAGLRDLAVHRDQLPTVELRALASGHGVELGAIGLDVHARDGTPALVLDWMERTRALALTTTLPAAGTSRRARGGSVRGRTRLGLGRLRERLEGRVLVELGRHGSSLTAVVVEPRRARVVELGHVEPVLAHLPPLVFALRRLANPRSGGAVAAARESAELRLRLLRAALVAPLGVAEEAELVVVPAGGLHAAPWSALHGGPVGLAPSVGMWARTREQGPGPPVERPVLVAGPDLVGARREVEALQEVHPSARVLQPHEAQARAVLGAMADASLVHLACHGTLRTDSPMFSAVSLGDGPLTVQEIHEAAVAPARLVLASCHSGADVAYAGDEVLGFVSAMLAQGTRGVVASSAAVPDVEVVDLMVALHRRLAAGETMARALHGARGEVDRDAPGGFVNWCTFAAHGGV